MVRYTPEMARAWQRVPKPAKGMRVDLVRYPEFLALRVYEGEIMAMDIDMRANVMDYLLKCKGIIQSHGTRCELEGIKGEPR